MNKNEILLSICIPTYGRAEILKKNLAHLTALSVFSDSQQWEIIISDNASPDSTKDVASGFAKRHPDRIHYFRNKENVNDDNFRLALTRGSGLYLKLCNDTLLLTDEGIRAMLACIRENRGDKPNLYFRCQDGNAPAELCYSFDAFIRSVGYMCTWIAEYGIWRSDFVTLSDFGRAKENMLIQVDATFRMQVAKPQTVVLRRHFFDFLPKPLHHGFAPSKIFGQNYFALLRPYLESGLVSPTAFARDKYRMFRYVILPNYLITKPTFRFPRTDYIQNLWPEYKTKAYFYFFIPFVFAAIPIALLRRLFRR